MELMNHPFNAITFSVLSGLHLPRDGRATQWPSAAGQGAHVSAGACASKGSRHSAAYCALLSDLRGEQCVCVMCEVFN